MIIFRILRSFLLWLQSSIPGATRNYRLRRFLWSVAGYPVGHGARINGGVRIYGSGTVKLGADTWLGINTKVYLGTGSSVTIGSACDIAPEVVFHTGTHELGPAVRRAGTPYSAEIFIGNGCWIGTRVTVLAGARIGEGSIVAAGSLVRSGEYPCNVLLAGTPAVIKKHFTE